MLSIYLLYFNAISLYAKQARIAIFFVISHTSKLAFCVHNLLITPCTHPCNNHHLVVGQEESMPLLEEYYEDIDRYVSYPVDCMWHEMGHLLDFILSSAAVYFI